MLLRKGKVTAIVTAYNAERYISRCIESIINQKDEVCEIIIVNDGSKDKTESAIKKYQERITSIEFPQNMGPAVGRTVGLFNTKTEFVAFIDADDFWLSDFAHTMKGFLELHPDIIAANCSYIKRDYKGMDFYRPILKEDDKEYYKQGQVCPDFYEFWAKYHSILTGTVLMRTEIALKTGGQRKDLRLTQDLEFWGYLATFGKWAFIPKHLFVTDERVLKPSERLAKFKRRFSFFKNLDVKSWSERIMPSINNQQSIAFFNEFLRTIITTIAFAKAYSFDIQDSYRYAKIHKDQIMPNGWGKAIKLGLKLGLVGWPFVCLALRLREIFKAYLFPTKQRMRER